MKGYAEFRGLATRLAFDPIRKIFEPRLVAHGFTRECDALERQMLADLGIDAEALAEGRVELIATIETKFPAKIS
jgi:hypothetical protein